MAAIFDSTELRDLAEEYTFYQYVNDAGEGIKGQYFAVRNDQEPVQNGDLFTFSAVVKILNQANSAVRLATADSDFINKSKQVAGSNSALTVSKTHPSLITFLLKLAA